MSVNYGSTLCKCQSIIFGSASLLMFITLGCTYSTFITAYLWLQTLLCWAYFKRAEFMDREYESTAITRKYDV